VCIVNTIKKTSGLRAFTRELHTFLFKEIASILCNFFQKIQEERTFSTAFYEDSIILKTKPDSTKNKQTNKQTKKPQQQ
jgi:hypothetical protein